METQCDKIHIKESRQEPYKTWLSGFPSSLANLSARQPAIWNTWASVISSEGSPPISLGVRVQFPFIYTSKHFFSLKRNASTFQNSSPEHTNFLYPDLKIGLSKYDGHLTELTKTRNLLVRGYNSTVPKMQADCFMWWTPDIWKIYFCIRKHNEQHKTTV